MGKIPTSDEGMKKWPFVHRVRCGDCNCFCVTTRVPDGYRCHNHLDEPAYAFSIPTLSWAVSSALKKEKRLAQRLQKQVIKGIENGLPFKVDAHYLSRISALTDEMRENCDSINDLCISYGKPGPYPDEMRLQIGRLTKRNWKLAGKGIGLYKERLRFQQGYTTDNAWLQLYLSLPENPSISKDMLRMYTGQIITYHDRSITVELKEQDAKAELLWCLGLPAKRGIRKGTADTKEVASYE